jgi:hypothetical protein
MNYKKETMRKKNDGKANGTVLDSQKQKEMLG